MKMVLIFKKELNLYWKNIKETITLVHYINGYSDADIMENKIYVTEYEGEEFRGSIDECTFDEKKNYKVYIKDYKGELFHIGYVPAGKVAEIEEWMDDNKGLEMRGSVYITGGRCKYCSNNGDIANEKNEYEFEVELRFYNNNTSDQNEGEKFGKLLKKWWVWLCLVVLFIGIYGIRLLCKPKFTVEDFSISKETIEYTYADDTIYYSGEGKIVCSDTKNNYLVLVNIELVSGGNKEDDEYTSLVTVVDGEGEISTFDSGNEGGIEKPKYDFEILGYIKMK